MRSEDGGALTRVIRVVAVDREAGVVTVEVVVDGVASPSRSTIPITLQWPTDWWKFYEGQSWDDPEWGRVAFPDVYGPHKSKITKQSRAVASCVALKACELSGNEKRRRKMAESKENPARSLEGTRADLPEPRGFAVAPGRESLRGLRCRPGPGDTVETCDEGTDAWTSHDANERQRERLRAWIAKGHVA